MTVPAHCVIDTNVPMTANNANSGAPPECMAASARALQYVMAEGHLYIDADGRIVSEYRANLSARGQPGPGDAFLKWVLTHEWGEQRITRVPVTRSGGYEENYEELPEPDDGTVYDPSDRKFLAVAAAHASHPDVVQSFDTKWWGWRDSLAKIGVHIHFLCEEEVKRKYLEKHAK
jgi:hypothetical protein